LTGEEEMGWKGCWWLGEVILVYCSEIDESGYGLRIVVEVEVLHFSILAFLGIKKHWIKRCWLRYS
jgi:hypothetical protein